MDKLKMQTVNKADENFKKLAAMFPNAVTETLDETTGEVVRAIDKDVLMQEISCKVVDGNEERYQFTWPDKKKSVLLANAPINKTLRPCREESIDFDNTANLYIEGDNLEVLKLIQETYLGKIKMIYIDPPYNTGSDLVYSSTSIQSSLLKGLSKTTKAVGKIVERIPVVGDTQADETLIAAGEKLGDIGTEKIRKQMSQLIERQSNFVRPFIDNIDTVNRLNNNPIQLLVDKDNLYIATIA